MILMRPSRVSVIGNLVAAVPNKIATIAELILASCCRSVWDCDDCSVRFRAIFCFYSVVRAHGHGNGSVLDSWYPGSLLAPGTRYRYYDTLSSLCLVYFILCPELVQVPVLY